MGLLASLLGLGVLVVGGVVVVDRERGKMGNVLCGLGGWREGVSGGKCWV